MPWIRFSSLMMCCLLVLGCGGGSSELPEYAKDLVPVTGQVTWKGEPLAGATVRFLLPNNAEVGESAEGVTDAQGNYSLLTMMASASIEERTGAVPAEYQVVISSIVRPDGSPLPPDVTEADALAEGAKELLPSKYSDPERTTLRETVKSEPTVIDFELQP